jgi:CheY-like chemotaxis protein
MKAARYPILLVEDDPNDVALIQRAFDNARVANPLCVVGDGEQALGYLRGAGRFADRKAHPLPIMLLLDLKLPRTSGLEVLAWVRSQPDLKRLPVVVLTSSRQSTDINQAYDLGVNSYLVKPVDFASLVEMVRAVDLYWLLLNEKPSVD